MKKHLFIFVGIIALSCFCFSSCSQAVKKNNDGISIQLKSEQSNVVKSIRLQVVTDDIIHVTATPDKFSKNESLIASYSGTKTTGWDYRQTESEAILKTTTTIATVSLQTGEIVFSDKQGNVILKENEGGGKSFQPMQADGYNAYSIRQVLESPDDEAFYGLGQHQSDEFNYKGRNEILYQYNTKVSVPFIVSNKNYGILFPRFGYKNKNKTSFGRLKRFCKYLYINGLQPCVSHPFSPPHLYPPALRRAGA